MLLVSVILGEGASFRLPEFTIGFERNSLGWLCSPRCWLLVSVRPSFTTVIRIVFVQPVHMCFCSHGLLFQTVENLGHCLQVKRKNPEALEGSIRAAWAQEERVSMDELIYTSGSGRGTTRRAAYWGEEGLLEDEGHLSTSRKSEKNIPRSS